MSPIATAVELEVVFDEYDSEDILSEELPDKMTEEYSKLNEKCDFVISKIKNRKKKIQQG